MTSVETLSRRRTPWLLGIGVAIPILIILGFIVRRLLVDVPSLTAGTVPEDEYHARFVRHPWLTYVHILLGLLYMIGATLQLAYWFRSRHYTVHRRIGRILLSAGLVTGVTSIVMSLWFPFGGLAELSAVVLFSIWFLVCLLLAFRAIRADDMVRHRRWMIRAFAIGIGVGTIRVWTGLFVVGGLLELPAAIGASFWIALSLHALVAELYLRARPVPPESLVGSANYAGSPSPS